MPFELANIKLTEFRSAFSAMVGAKPTRALLRQASQELLRPIIGRKVSVAAEVFSEAATLMGQLNIQLLKLPFPFSFSLTGGKEGPIDGKKLLGDGRVGGLTWKTDARDNNEDGIVFAILPASDKSAADKETIEETILFLIADGMGGHAAGEVASEQALMNIGTSFDDNASGFDLPAAAVAANDALIALKAPRKELKGAGTTLVAALIKPARNEAQIVHAGDSRFYLLRARTGSRLAILTCDDNIANLIIRKLDQTAFPLEGDAARAYYEETNAESRAKNIVTRSVGMEKLEEKHFSPITVALEEGDLLIGASDGLNFLPWNYLEETIIANRDKSPVELAEALKAALAGLTGDNVTVGVYRHGQRPVTEKAPEPPTDKKVKGTEDEPTTTVWDAPPEVKAAFIEEATRVLELPPELQERFAKLLEENAEFREAMMRDARIAIKRTEERDAAQAKVRELEALIATLQTQNSELQSRLAKTPAASLTTVLDLRSNVEQLLAEWRTIEKELQANLERSETAEENAKLARLLAGQYQKVIEDATAPIDVELETTKQAHQAQEAAVLSLIRSGIEMLQGQSDTAQKTKVKDLVEKEIKEQRKLAIETETELAAKREDALAAIRAKKDQSPFPRLREHLATQEARLHAAEEILTQLAGEKARIIEERLTPLRDRLAALRTSAEEVATAAAQLAGLIAGRDQAAQLPFPFTSK